MDSGEQDGALPQHSWLFSHSPTQWCSHEGLFGIEDPHMDTLLAWWGVGGTAESRVHMRMPTYSVEAAPLSQSVPDQWASPRVGQPCRCGLAIFHLSMPSLALKLVLRDSKITAVERLLLAFKCGPQKGLWRMETLVPFQLHCFLALGP